MEAPAGGGPQGPAPYPVDVVAEYPDRSSRLMAFLVILFGLKFLLLIPHMLVLMVLSLAALVATVLGYLAVLFGGSYPPVLWDFVVGVLRWNTRINAWAYGLVDEYPPFRLGEGDYPVDMTAVYPQSSSRLLALSGLLFLLKAALLIPHMVVLYFVGLALMFVLFIGYWAVLILGQYPRSLWDFALGCLRWNTRVGAWLFGVVDPYPPFSLQ